MNVFCKSLLLLTGMAVVMPAAASDPGDAAEARLSWQVGFGGPGNTFGKGYYSLTLAHRPADAGVPALKLAELAVSGAGTHARLMGVPLAPQDYQANMADTRIEGLPSWMTLDVIWWVVSGVALTVIVLDKANDDDADPIQGTGGTGGT
ncbi:MAG TPA: hypothetical protein VGA59_07205 [Ramlibacter sp.]|jgi:hypothetical protein